MLFLSYKIGLWAFPVVALTIPFLLACGYYTLASLRPKRFPPGPCTAPVLGNLHQVRLSGSFLQFHQWTQKYGSIIGLKFGPQDVVILNSWKHVRELFDKRGAIYSSRPASYVANELMCPNEVHILLVPYGPGWKLLRKTLHGIFSTSVIDGYLPIQNAEACQTLHQILQEPENYYDHIRRFSPAVILASVYGQRGASFNSPKLQALYHVAEKFLEIIEPGATPPVDAFPLLKALPEFLSPWRTKAKAFHEEQRALYFGLMTETKERISKGVRTGCFLEKVLEQQEQSGLRDEQVAYLCGTLMEAASDTTSSTLLSFVLAMIKYPRVLRACQDEVDNVCGVERLPGTDEVREMPYLKACMTEMLRWRPAAAGGFPHVLTQDDTYGEYVLRKDTIVLANAWAIGRDPDEFDQPDEFIPERFLNNPYGIRDSCGKEGTENANRRATYAFGAGRRICTGQRMAEDSLLLNMAKLCWAFDITSPIITTTTTTTSSFLSSDTKVDIDVEVETAYTVNLAITPLKFPARFVPRSDQHVLVMEREFLESEALSQRYQ